MDKRYSRQEVEEILKRALSGDGGDAIAHDDLVAAAAEVGVDASSVEQAATELRRERKRLGLRDDVLRVRRNGFLRHLSTYLVVNLGLLGLDLAGGGGFWVHWPAIGWGIPLALHALRSYFPNDANVEKAVERAQRKAEKEARRADRDRRPDTDEARRGRARQREAAFERLVEDGLDALLNKASEQLDKRVTRPKVRVAEPTATRQDSPDSTLPDARPPHRHKR